MKKQLIPLLLLCYAATLGAKVKLHSLVGDNMIVQQQTDVRLWGTARAGAEIKVTPSWSGQTSTCRADAQGHWLLTVKTPQASMSPYEITFDDGEPLTVKNVLVGEVWLASGQSNMEMPLKGYANYCVKDAAQEIINASSTPQVRMFNVPHKQEYEPQTECGGSWMVPSIETAPEFSATAWFFAKSLSQALGLPVGIINCTFGGSTVESWTNRELLETYPDISLKPEDHAKMKYWLRPLLMYNGMLKPLQNYTIKGIIWYQGCSNVGRHETYAQRLANMVDLWRKEWGLGEIPFYYAEITPYTYDKPEQAGKAAYLREAQFKAQSLIPNSAMTSTNDLVEPYERYINHPRNKQAVGLRLSLLALNLTYGQKQLMCFGPQYKSWTDKGNEAWISFDHVEMGICRNYDIQGFEVAGEDRVFYPADSVWLHLDTNEVVVSSRKVSKPVAVRYCFHDFQPGNLIGVNELPLVPFRTDDW